MHKHMALSIKECIELTHLKEKVTAVIPTFSAPINCFMWSILSLLLRSKSNGILEHFVICINGPDKRTGDPSLQDEKQKFCEELRKMKWEERDMPITVIRAWSRVGHPEAVEMAMPWIHTDAYVLMHDDIIITGDPSWEDEVAKKFYANPKVALAYGSNELFFAHCDHCIAHGLYMLRLPSMYTHFLIARKSIMRELGANWLAYNLGSYENPIQFDLEEEIENLKEFEEYYKKKGMYNHPPQTQEMYNFVNMGMGAWVYEKINQSEFIIEKLNPEIITHFSGMSMWNDPDKEHKIEAKEEYIEEIENDIANSPYDEIYQKYKEKE